MPGSNSVAKLKDEQEVWPLRLHVVPRPLDNSAARQTVADASAAPLPNMAAGQDSGFGGNAEVRVRQDWLGMESCGRAWCEGSK